MVLDHVGLAHVFGQARGRGLLAREIVGGLLAVAHRQRGVAVQISGFLHHLDEVAARDFAKHIAGARSPFHVLGEQARVGLADLGEGFAGDKVDDFVELQALVRLAPSGGSEFSP
jgi:hypothetical protein